MKLIKVITTYVTFKRSLGLQLRLRRSPTAEVLPSGGRCRYQHT